MRGTDYIVENKTKKYIFSFHLILMKCGGPL